MARPQLADLHANQQVVFMNTRGTVIETYSYNDSDWVIVELNNGHGDVHINLEDDRLVWQI